MNLKKELESLPNGSVALIISDAENITRNNIKILKILTKNYSGVYITIGQPYDALKKILEKSKINTNRIFFIDCITKTAGGGAKRTRDCLFIESPSDLTELGIGISEAINALPKGKRFVFLDTLSTLLIYNSAGTIARFSHFLISRIKILGLKGIIISVEKEMDERLSLQISQFCDKVIRIKDGKK